MEQVNPSTQNTNVCIDEQAPEKTIWSGSSSQWLNARVFIFSGLILCALFAVVVMVYSAWILLLAPYPLIRSAYEWYKVKTAHFKLTGSRLVFSTGVFTRLTSEVELYSVSEVLMEEKWYERIVGLGTILLRLRSGSDKDFRLPLINHPTEVRELIRQAIVQRRTENGPDTLVKQA